MKFIKYNGKRKQDLENLLKSIYTTEIPYYILNLENVVIAYKDDKMIGFAAYQKSNLHDKVVTIEIGILTSHRRCGIGTKLHEILFMESPLKDTELGIDGCCYSNNKVAQRFLNSLGYSKYLDCNCLILDIQQATNFSKGLEIKSLSNLYKIESYKDDVKKFYISRYTKEHKWSPVTTDTSVWEDYYDDGNSLELGVVILNKNKVIGCSFAYERFGEELEYESNNLLGIGGTYVFSNNLDDEFELTKNMLCYQFHLSSEAGHKEAYIEVDSTEAISNKLLEWLPIKRRQVYERYRLKS